MNEILTLGEDAITMTHIPLNGMTFESKERLGRVCLLRHLVYRWQSPSVVTMLHRIACRV